MLLATPWSHHAGRRQSMTRGTSRTSWRRTTMPFGTISPLDLAGVRIAAWSTFFLRYTDLRFSSARHLNAYRLALRGISRRMRPD
jgi:hypothetical protein